MKAAEIRVTYRKKNHSTPTVISSNVAQEIFRNSWQKDLELRERFKVMYLDMGNNVLGIHETSAGTLSGCLVDVRHVLAIALKVNACSIILCHNHPSGNLNASHQDIQITEKVREAGKILDVGVLDHIILTSEGYTSMTDEGQM